MKENETLLMLDNVNQQIGERSLTQRCHRSPTGPPQLEVRKHLRRTNDCKSVRSSILRVNAAQSLRQQRDGHNHATSLTYGYQSAYLFRLCGLFSLTDSPIKETEEPEHMAASGKANYSPHMCNSVH